MFHIQFTYIHILNSDCANSILPDRPEQKCCMSHRVPAELTGFWNVYHLVLGGGDGPKITDKSFWQTKIWRHLPTISLVVFNETTASPETRYLWLKYTTHVIWTISMFITYTVSKVQLPLSISHCHLGTATIKACPCSHQNTVLRVTVLCLGFINPKTTIQILQTPHPIHIIILALPMMMIVTCST